MTSETSDGRGAATERVAVITGASRGLGAQMARRLVRDGYFVVATYRSDEAAARAVEASLEGRGVAVRGDVRGLASARALLAEVDAALTERGLEARFDALVLNAGVMVSGAFAETSEESFDEVFAVNVRGVFFLLQQSLARLRDGGRVVTLGSGLSRVANPERAAYSATKGAIDVLTRGWAKELGARNITVNTVAPGAIDTDMNASWLRSEQGRAFLLSHSALKRVPGPEDIAGLVAFLLSPEAGWVTGQRIEASGGYQL